MLFDGSDRAERHHARENVLALMDIDKLSGGLTGYLTELELKERSN